MTFLVILLVIGAIRYITEPSAIEPFAASSEGQCNAITNCADCASEDKCGWCSSSNRCHLKGRFGDGDGKCDARSFTTFKEQCSAASSGVATARGSTYNADRENRRLAMIKKYVDRIGTNYNALSLASSREDARDYIQDKLTYSG